MNANKFEIIQDSIYPDLIKVCGYGQRFWCKILSNDNGLYELQVDNDTRFVDENFPLKLGDIIYLQK